ncbi:NAD(P)H-hydrate dehydratase [Adhaeribacter aquaticus]|uniref:NAD(P)H-hydrate dehydratase n=1 Tax=Adhaeribacter aquaticus TaxID=299567 RepID=UPI00040C1C17|nr:NAD(P)H-hydrate dehydratase [Adhaeribacter aquaticus]
MKILTAPQIREADQQTIQEERIASVDLMERAAKAFVNWFDNKFKEEAARILVCCGPGNNGGDGLAIARLLFQKHYAVQVWIVAPESARFSSDFIINQERLPQDIQVSNISDYNPLPEVPAVDFIIDGLFGTGLSRPVTGLFAEVISSINKASATKIAIDTPSGLFTEVPNQPTDIIIQAAYTVSFELPKLTFFLPQNFIYVGEWQTVPIGLSTSYIKHALTDNFVISGNQVAGYIKPRTKFSHKGTYGHALLMAGSYGKMGAAILASRACLRSGVGLLTIQCPKTGYAILQTAVPEAMTLPDSNKTCLTELPDIDKYQVIGIGPGLDKRAETKAVVRQLLHKVSFPIVLDADALNILSEEKELLQQLPAASILTPHPKEFERLVGKAENDYQRLEQLKTFCQQYKCYVVLKGGHTCIGTPTGELYFNCTGNPGMATGGTGDVLTGIITALLAQKYSSLEACLLGVYIHGLAGDIASQEKGEFALVASDVIEYLGKAFLQLQPDKK